MRKIFKYNYSLFCFKFTHIIAQMKDYSKIAGMIKMRRLELSLSQQDLSEMSEVALRTVNALETGKASINLKNLTAIADVLGLELHLAIKKQQGDDEAEL